MTSGVGAVRVGRLVDQISLGVLTSSVPREVIDGAAARFGRLLMRARVGADRRGRARVPVAGRVLTGWVVIDMDATIIEPSSATAGAAGTFKKSFGPHPLAGWCANTQECLAMLLRQGCAGSNTVADHLEVRAACIAQIPAGYRAKLLIRVDGAGASHGQLEQIETLS